MKRDGGQEEGENLLDTPLQHIGGMINANAQVQVEAVVENFAVSGRAMSAESVVIIDESDVGAARSEAGRVASGAGGHDRESSQPAREDTEKHLSSILVDLWIDSKDFAAVMKRLKRGRGKGGRSGSRRRKG